MQEGGHCYRADFSIHRGEDSTTCGCIRQACSSSVGDSFKGALPPLSNHVGQGVVVSEFVRATTTFSSAEQDHPYDPSKDSILSRVKFMFGEQ